MNVNPPPEDFTMAACVRDKRRPCARWESDSCERNRRRRVANYLARVVKQDELDDLGAKKNHRREDFSVWSPRRLALNDRRVPFTLLRKVFVEVRKHVLA